MRSLLLRSVQGSLAVAGVALGVTVAVSINLANTSAERAFTLSTEAISGTATDQIVGGPGRIADDVFPRLVQAGFTVAPIVEGWVLATPPNLPRRNLHLLGIDPLSDGAFRNATSPGAEAPITPALLAVPGSALVAGSTARTLGLHPGSHLLVRTELRSVPLLVIGTVGGASDDAALADVVITDISTAQEILGRNGTIDRIDVRLPAGDTAARVRLNALLPASAQLLAAGTRTETALAMTRAFRINLTALSLLALVCGTFLIYNTVSFSVVQRRPLFGILRSMGVTRGGIFALVLGEAALLGVVGTALGLAGGVVLGRGLVQLVTRTINDLYFALTVRVVEIPASTVTLGILLGMGATLLAALAPAAEATFTPPRAALGRSVLEQRVRRALPRAAGLGVVLLAGGVGILAWPRSGLIACFAALFAVTLGFALMTPLAAATLLRAARNPLGALWGPMGRMTAGRVVATLSRSAVAIAALVIATSVTVGMGVMIVSFRVTVARWLDSSLVDDLYISPAYRSTAPRAASLPFSLSERAAQVPGVGRVDTIRRADLTTPSGQVRLLAVGGGARAFSGFAWRDVDALSAWKTLAADGVLISEAFAEHTGLHTGGSIVLPTQLGPRRLLIGGEFSDYASDRGAVLMRRETYLRLFADPALTAFSVALAPHASLAATRDRLAVALNGEVPVNITSNRDLKRFSLEIFDRTFLITDVLRLLAALVAGLGVLSALAALALEGAREFAVLRAQGLTPGQLWKLVLGQSALIGLTAGLLALPVGLGLAVIMIKVINRLSFGWTVPFVWSPGVLLQALALTLGASLLAGIYPAWRSARTRPAEALREE
jgi:putative ABC transport system permease protein